MSFKFCPFCGVSLIGEEIPTEFKHHYKSTHYHREIGIVDPDLDEAIEYECPDCHERWKHQDEHLPLLVGLAEVAEILGKAKQTVSTLYRRAQKKGFPEHMFPKPIQELSSGPIWTRKQIEEYKKQRADK